MYAEELEDFAASNDHAALDEWVFDRAIEVLRGNVTEEEAANGATVELERAALEGDRVVFLLHLLGLDSAGHAHKPFGEAYAKNVRVVDDGVRRLSAAFKGVRQRREGRRHGVRVHCRSWDELRGAR